MTGWYLVHSLTPQRDRTVEAYLICPLCWLDWRNDAGDPDEDEDVVSIVTALDTVSETALCEYCRIEQEALEEEAEEGFNEE